jgi:hypothetical protein
VAQAWTPIHTFIAFPVAAVHFLGGIVGSVVAFCYFMGFFVSLGALSRMGSLRNDTIGDSFSGDGDLDMLLAMLWPVFWPGWFAYRIGQRGFSRGKS